jgi:hypothetical protein
MRSPGHRTPPEEEVKLAYKAVEGKVAAGREKKFEQKLAERAKGDFVLPAAPILWG